MNTILILTKATTKMFLRNKQALFFTLFMPLVIMFVFGVIGFDNGQTFDIGLVSTRPNAGTLQFISQLKDVSVLKITEGTLENELAQLKDGKRVAVLSVPDNFITPGSIRTQELHVYVNESKQAQAQAVVSMLSHFLDATSLQLAHAPQYFTIKQEVIDSKNLKYFDFLLPGLIAMSVMQMSVFSVAFVFAQYREKGVLKRLLATPMRPADFVTANIITRMCVSVFQTILFIAVGLILGAHIVGNYFLVLLCIILGVLMFLGLGFAMSGFAKTVESVPAIANLVAFPMLFLGGVFFPLDSMPHWLRIIAQALPLTHFAEALRMVMTEGAGFMDIGWRLLVMVGWVIVLVVAAMVSFSFSDQENA